MGASGHRRYGVEQQGCRRSAERSDRVRRAATRSPGGRKLRELMAEIGFYHLTRSTLAQALPQLLARTLAAGQRAVVLASDPAGVEALSTTLWAHPAWLPHGTSRDGDPDLQPIWLTTDPASLNGAHYLFLTDSVATDRV